MGNGNGGNGKPESPRRKRRNPMAGYVRKIERDMERLRKSHHAAINAIWRHQLKLTDDMMRLYARMGILIEKSKYPFEEVE